MKQKLQKGNQHNHWPLRTMETHFGHGQVLCFQNPLVGKLNPLEWWSIKTTKQN